MRAAAAELASQLAQAEKEQAVYAKAVAKAKPLQKKIAEQSDALGNIRAAADTYRIAEEAMDQWRKEIKDATVERSLPKLPSAALEAQLAASVQIVRGHLLDALRELDSVKRTPSYHLPLRRTRPRPR